MTLTIRLLLALTVSAAPAVANAQRTLTSPVEPFDSVFTLVRRVPLASTAEEPVGVVPLLGVTETRLYVVDGSNGNLKVFDLANGRLVATMGRAGDGPGELRRLTGMVVDPDGSVSTIDNSRKALVRRDPTGRLIGEVRLQGQWNGLGQVTVGSKRQLILTGRSGVLNREGGIPVQPSTPVLHEVDSSGLGRSSFSVVWPESPWQRSFANYFSSGSGSILATAGYATNVVRFSDWSTNREWADTLRAAWLKPITWPKDEQFGTGTKIQQMNEWVKQQTLVTAVFLGSPRWYVAQVQAFDQAGETLWGYIVSTTDGRTRRTTAPFARKIQAVHGETAYLLTEDESGNYVLEVRRIRLTR